MVILPSTSESFSYTLIESLFAKKVVIVASESGNDEFINDGENGFVFQNDNFEHLSKIIDSILSKPKLRSFTSSNASKGLNSKFSYPKIYQKSKEAYIHAIEKYLK